MKGRKVHWITALNRPACGSRGRLRTTNKAALVTCGGCLNSWAYAIGGLGCEDERKRKRP